MRKFCYAAEESGVERFRAEFFEVARKDGLSGGRWVFTGKGEFDEIMTCYEGCGGFGVAGYWIWIFNDEEVDPGMRIVPQLMMSGCRWNEVQGVAIDLSLEFGGVWCSRGSHVDV